jgi:hypothetical protein
LADSRAEWLEGRVLLSATGLTASPPISVAPAGDGSINTPADIVPNLNGALTPGNIQIAYGVNSISFSGVAGTGAGQTIAIIDAYNNPNIIADAATYSTQYGLPQFNTAGNPTLKVLNESGQGSPLAANTTSSTHIWDEEISADVEWAHSIAPMANIILFEAGSSGLFDLYSAAATAAAYAGVSVVSMSFGSSEFSSESNYDSIFTTPTGHQGVTFLASTGDSGSPAEYPAYSPNVVAVGGSVLTVNSDGSYNTESGWSGSGGGISKYETQPAFQSGNVNGLSTTLRTAPDVSILATGLSIYDSWAGGANNGGYVSVSGTSLSCPIWAGLIAIADQGRVANGLGTLDGPSQTLPMLYQLPSTDFHDITSGSNGASARAGYDLVSGRGTPIANRLIPDLMSPVPTVTSVTAGSGPSTGGTSVVINGTNFTGVTAVRFGSIAATSFVVNSSTQITAIDPPEAAGEVNVIVTSKGTSPATGINQFTYALANTATTISSDTPNPATTAQPISFSVSVSGGVPDGETVTLQDASNGNAIVGTGMLSMGSATITIAAGALSIGTHNIFASYGGDASYAASQSSQMAQVVTAVATTFEVAALNPTTSGFNVTFDRALNPATLALYGASRTLIPDVTLYGASTGAVAGSLVWNAATNTLQFVKTENAITSGGAATADPLGGYARTDAYLAPDTYTVTLTSGANGLKDSNGNALDGNDNGGSANFSTTFTVGAYNGLVVTLPDFARAPGESVNTLDDGTAGNSTISAAAGLPIRISDGNGVQSVAFDLSYDPSILQINGITPPSGWTASFDNSTPGLAKFTVSSNSGSSLTATDVAADIAHVSATVLSSAAYGSSEVLSVSGVVVNQGALAAQGDEAIHKVALLGDTNDDGSLGSTDAALIARVTVGTDAAFNAYPLTDPRIVGDVTGDGTVSGLDAGDLSSAAVGNSVPQIEDVYSAYTTMASVDPALSLPTHAIGVRGGTVSLPVSVTETPAEYAAGGGVESADLGFTYNSSLVHLSGLSAIQINSALQSQGWQIGAINLNDAAGTVRISMYTTGNALPAGTATLLNLVFSVAANAPAGVSPVSIDTSGTPSHTRLNEGQLSLTPIDGEITIPIAVSILDAPANITYGTSVKFDATNSTDVSLFGQAAGSLGYQWTVTEAGNTVDTSNTSLLNFTPTVGTYVVTLAVTDSAGNVGTNSQTITVGQATPTISWATPAAITYGTALGAQQLDAGASWTVAGSLGSVNGTFAYTPGAGTILHAGQNQQLSVTFTPSDALDYTPATQSVLINVGQAPLTITADDKAMTYGGTLPPLTANYSGFVNGDTAATVTGLTLSTVPATSHAGTYAITPSGAINGDYAISYVVGHLTIGQATLTITADDKAMTYGGTLPPLTASYSGFVNGDTAAGVTGLTLSTVPATSHAGIYAITASGAVDGDYAINYVSGNLTIGQAPLTITAADKTMTYGGTLPPLTANYSGLVNGDTATSLTGLTLSTVPANSHAGTYAITPSGAVDGDYAITYITGHLTIGQAPLTITAADKAMTYGGALPQLTANYSGLVNGDTTATITGLTLSTVPATSHAGTYAITLSGAVDSDYAISYVAGHLTIGQAVLTITADDKTMTYGGTLPPLTADYSGFVNGDTAAGVTGLTLSTVPATSHAGTYSITASGAVDGDYAISYVSGNLTIGQAPLTITVADKAMTYGGTLPPLTASYNGLVNGDTASSVSGLTLSTVPATSHAGTYAITASGAVNGDYAISYVSGNLTIGQAPLTITADDKAMAYGGTLPTLTANYSGLVNGDTAATITGLTLSTVPANSPVGTYAITASGAVDGDYAINYVVGNLTIGQAPLTITAADKAMTYGGTLPPLTANYSGLVKGDTAATVTGLTLSTVPANSHAGTYAITASGAVDGDYAISYVAGNLAIGQAPLTINIPNDTQTFGYPANLASDLGSTVATGINGQTLNVAYASTGNTASAAVGSYAIAGTPSNGTALLSDYNVTLNPGTLSVVHFAVTSVTPNASGVDFKLNAPASVSSLNLYDGENNAGQAIDLTVTNTGTGQAVNGSVVFNANDTAASWVATGGILSAGNYALNLLSGFGSWSDAVEALNGTAGSNFNYSFSVTAPTAPTITIPDFARGPGQGVDVPVTAPGADGAAGATGLPVTLSNANGVNRVDLQISYNRNLLTISSVALDASMSTWSGSNLSWSTAGGLLTIHASGPALGSGVQTLFEINSTVPSTATYGAAQVLAFTSAMLNGSTNAVGDEAMDKVAFTGDATGDGSYSGMDASLIARVVVGMDSGFDAYALTDPVVVGDVTGDGTLSGLDAADVARESVGGIPEITGIPSGFVPLSNSGSLDPQVSVGNETAAPGGSVVIPVTINSATGLQAADFTFTYDSSLITLSNSGVTLGTLAAGWQEAVNVGNGLVRVSLYDADPLSGGSGTLLNLTAQVSAAATPGTMSPIDIASGPTPSRLNEGSLTLTAVNGAVTVQTPTVVGEYIFYHDSYYSDPANGGSDNAAIDTSKTALLPGQTATFANWTSYDKGINGVMVDIANLPANATLSANDFNFLEGNSSTLSNWTTAPPPSQVLTVPGGGVNGSTRVELIWPDGSIVGQWLQISVVADANTGLAATDVFYFGNAPGDSGDPNTAGFVAVNEDDELAARNNITNFVTNPATVTDPYDYNRDGIVNEDDELLARNHETNFLTGLQIITAPQAGSTSDAQLSSSKINATAQRTSTAASAVTSTALAALATAAPSSQKKTAPKMPVAPILPPVTVKVTPKKSAPLVVAAHLPDAHPNSTAPSLVKSAASSLTADGVKSKSISKAIELII